MTEPSAGREPDYADADESSLLVFGSVLLRERRRIVALGVCGAVLGLALGLLSTRVYMSSTTFIPQQGSEGGAGAASGLALAASQFGIRVPSGGGAWGPPVYVELLSSRALLEPIALDTVAVAEEGGRRVALMDLLEVPARSPARRTELALRKLAKIVDAAEVRNLGAVKLTVTTRWPSVSLALAQQLVRGVNRFNVETRKSQAGAERQFLEVQSGEAERALRTAEDRLQAFLQGNRILTGSSQPAFQLDRLKREVSLREQVYTSLLQNLEEARTREVRDTPVITVLEDPRLPIVGEPRKTVQKFVLGGIVGAMLGVLLAFLAQSVAGARRVPSEAAREFFGLMEEATPRFLKRKRA